jgi:hypothetical protein
MFDGLFIGLDMFTKPDALAAPKRSALLADAPVPRAGYGSCQVIGCHCGKYESSGWQCTNCLHKFEDHAP